MAQDDGEASSRLMRELIASKILDSYSAADVLTAFMGLASEALHRETKLGAVKCLQVIERAAKTMVEHEKRTRMLQGIFDKSSWRREPEGN